MASRQDRIWATLTRGECLIGFARKTCSFDDNVPTVNPNVILALLGQEAYGEIVRVGDEIFDKDDTEQYGISPCTDFTDDFYSTAPNAFILSHDGKEFLVNTEGYQYCRYICRIE